MKSGHFNLTPGAPDRGKLHEAVQAAMDEEFLLELEPGDYFVDAPVHAVCESHQTRPWGVLGPGARVIATYEEAEPILMIEAIGNAVCRFLSMDGVAFKGTNRKQAGAALRSRTASSAIYRFRLQGLSAEGCDDAIRLEGNVFEGDVFFPWCADSNCGLALGNTDSGILSAINVWGGSLSQNKVDGLRTFAETMYREPYDFNLFGVYCGNNGRYSVNAVAGVNLMKGCRLENPWSDPATHDPKNDHERACVYFANHAVMEQCIGGGNGNGTALVDGYLSGALIMRDCVMTGAAAKKLARLNGNPAQAAADIVHCRPPIVEATPAVRLAMTP